MCCILSLLGNSSMAPKRLNSVDQSINTDVEDFPAKIEALAPMPTSLAISAMKAVASISSEW